MGTTAVFSYPAHHDLAWFLYAAAELLGGADLYVEVVEVNPPLIIWISVLAELGARITGLWNLFVYRALTLGLVVLSIVLCRRQLQRFDAPADTAVDLLTLLLTYAFIAGVGFEFGQREHLSLVLVFPFVLLVARLIDAPGPAGREDVLAGVLAGIGFAIKPHFLLALLPLQLYALVRRRRVLLGPAHVALMAMLVVYGLAVLLLEPDYLALARLSADTYARMSQESPIALMKLPPALFSAGAILVAFLIPRSAPLREACRVLALGAAGFLCAVLVQAKGWTYHWIPAITLSAALLTLSAWSGLVRLFPRLRSPAATTVALAAAAILLLVPALGKLDDADVHRQGMQHTAYRLPEMIDLVERHANGKTIAALSTNMQAAFPLVGYTDVRWGLRFNSLWLLPGAYPEYTPGSRVQYHPLDSMPPAERYMFDSVIADLVRTPPAILIVDRIPPGYRLLGFDYLTYFGRDPRFAALLQSYHEIQPIERYRILLRH